MIDVKTVTNRNVDIQSLLKGTNPPISNFAKTFMPQMLSALASLKCWNFVWATSDEISWPQKFHRLYNLDSRNQHCTASVDYITRHALVLYIVQGHIIYWRSRDSNPTHFGFVEGGTDKRFLTDDFTHFVYTPMLWLGLEPRTYGLTCYR